MCEGNLKVTTKNFDESVASLPNNPQIRAKSGKVAHGEVSHDKTLSGSAVIRERPVSRTSEADDVFFEVLSCGVGVSAAAEKAGYTRQTVYRWREEDPVFERRWARAKQLAHDAIEDEAMRRCLFGVEKPVYFRSCVVGHVRAHSDRFLLNWLQMHRKTESKN